MQVYVDDQTAKVLQVWTGYQVAWTMARGYPGAFGRRSNALYVWLPLCVLFIAPFLPWRRKPSLLHLDLLMLLGFSISLAFFNNADIGLSVPLVYPFLVYLLAADAAARVRQGDPSRAAADDRLDELADARSRIPARPADRARRAQLERDRRRLRRRDRRRQADPRSHALRPLAEQQRLRRHLRSGQLPRVRAVPADLRLERHLGLAPGRARGGDRRST